MMALAAASPAAGAILFCFIVAVGSSLSLYIGMWYWWFGVLYRLHDSELFAGLSVTETEPHLAN
jgi:hypothetical protein